jgi:hypothetical protein
MFLAIALLVACSLVPHPCRSILSSLNTLLTLLIGTLFPRKVYLHGISRPHCGRSALYFWVPVGAHDVVPPLFRNRAHTAENFLGICPAIVSLLLIATAYESEVLPGSVMQGRISPIVPPQIDLYTVHGNL